MLWDLSCVLSGSSELAYALARGFAAVVKSGASRLFHFEAHQLVRQPAQRPLIEGLAEGPRGQGGDLHRHRLVFRGQRRGAPRMGPSTCCQLSELTARGPDGCPSEMLVGGSQQLPRRIPTLATVCGCC